MVSQSESHQNVKMAIFIDGAPAFKFLEYKYVALESIQDSNFRLGIQLFKNGFYKSKSQDD